MKKVTQALYPCTLGREKRILLLGLDGSGKTYLLNKLKLGFKEIISTSPTNGYNVEDINYKNFVLWDVAGEKKFRDKVWRHFYQNTCGIIYVIDSAARDRFEEAKQELYTVLEDKELIGVPLLVFANKQDIPNVLSPSEISSNLDLDSLQLVQTTPNESDVASGLVKEERKEREWYVQGCCADNGKGVSEGLDWLSLQVYKI